MEIEINDNLYEVHIIKKKTTKNTYIRVSEELKIIVTTNIFTSDKIIYKIIEENILSIEKMVNKAKQKKEYNSKFYFLGKSYDIVYTNSNDVMFGDEKVFLGKNIDIDKFLKKQAETIFLERLQFWYDRFSVKIPYPSLTIRKMKSRWGVCNVKTKRITLNLELIKKLEVCLDYVIVHELSHLVYADHSSKFWSLVEENYPDYKKVRKLLKEY